MGGNDATFNGVVGMFVTNMQTYKQFVLIVQLDVY